MEAQSRKMMKEIIQNAENGNLEAQKQVSFMYMMLTSASDKDIKESGLATSLADAVDKAVLWMRKAAEQGDMEYQSKLGTYYMGNCDRENRDRFIWLLGSVTIPTRKNKLGSN